jgi:hypothetical protein
MIGRKDSMGSTFIVARLVASMLDRLAGPTAIVAAGLAAVAR